MMRFIVKKNLNINSPSLAHLCWILFIPISTSQKHFSEFTTSLSNIINSTFNIQYMETIFRNGYICTIFCMNNSSNTIHNIGETYTYPLHTQFNIIKRTSELIALCF